MKNKTADIDSDIQIVNLTPETIGDYGVCGYKDVGKHLELRRKIAWFTEYYPRGLRIKALISNTGGYQGMLEYIPGEYAHRPVKADGYLFIHCVFVGFRKEFKGKGYATRLLRECIDDASAQGTHGVAVVTRKGSFMAKRDFFLKNGFVSVATVRPDFELLVLKLSPEAPDPSFLPLSAEHYQQGLTILRSPQCPYSVKNVDAILKTARKMKLETHLVELATHEAAQHSPCAFGTFCIVKDGKVLSHHPISNGRFENIMKTAK